VRPPLRSRLHDVQLAIVAIPGPLDVLPQVNSTDWLLVFHPTPLKNDGVKVSWDDDIPFPIYRKIMKNQIPWFQTTNQINHGTPIIIP
jgi:hypothetical protein